MNRIIETLNAYIEDWESFKPVDELHAAEVRGRIAGLKSARGVVERLNKADKEGHSPSTEKMIQDEFRLLLARDRQRFYRRMSDMWWSFVDGADRVIALFRG